MVRPSENAEVLKSVLHATHKTLEIPKRDSSNLTASYDYATSFVAGNAICYFTILFVRAPADSISPENSLNICTGYDARLFDSVSGYSYIAKYVIYCKERRTLFRYGIAGDEVVFARRNGGIYTLYATYHGRVCTRRHRNSSHSNANALKRAGTSNTSLFLSANPPPS